MPARALHAALDGAFVTQTVIWGNPTSQWGTSTGAAWTTRAFADGVPVSIGPAQPHVGIIFAPTGLKFQGGRVVDNPSVSTLTLRLPIFGTFGNVTVRLWFVPQVDVADFSDTALPLTRGEVLLGTFTIIDPPAAFLTIFSLAVPGAALVDLRAQVTQRTRWTGRVAFVVEWFVGGASFDLVNGPTDAITASVTQELFFSGTIGEPGARVRAVRDHRYGMPALNTELVRDGDNPGLWVRPWDSDSEDEPARYRPRPGEGSVDDEVGTI